MGALSSRVRENPSYTIISSVPIAADAVPAPRPSSGSRHGNQVEVANRIVSDGLTRDEATEAKSPAGGAMGRGERKPKAKPRPVKSRVFKTEPGIRIIAERAKGIDPVALLAAVDEVAAKLRSEMKPAEGQAAA